MNFLFAILPVALGASSLFEPLHVAELDVASKLYVCRRDFQSGKHSDIAQCWQRSILEELWSVYKKPATMGATEPEMHPFVQFLRQKLPVDSKYRIGCVGQLTSAQVTMASKLVEESFSPAAYHDLFVSWVQTVLVVGTVGAGIFREEMPNLALKAPMNRVFAMADLLLSMETGDDIVNSQCLLPFTQPAMCQVIAERLDSFSPLDTSSNMTTTSSTTMRDSPMIPTSTAASSSSSSTSSTSTVSTSVCEITAVEPAEVAVGQFADKSSPFIQAISKAA